MPAGCRQRFSPRKHASNVGFSAGGSEGAAQAEAEPPQREQRRARPTSAPLAPPPPGMPPQVAGSLAAGSLAGSSLAGSSLAAGSLAGSGPPRASHNLWAKLRENKDAFPGEPRAGAGSLLSLALAAKSAEAAGAAGDTRGGPRGDSKAGSPLHPGVVGKPQNFAEAVANALYVKKEQQASFERTAVAVRSQVYRMQRRTINPKGTFLRW